MTDQCWSDVISDGVLEAKVGYGVDFGLPCNAVICSGLYWICRL